MKSNKLELIAFAVISCSIVFGCNNNKTPDKAVAVPAKPVVVEPIKDTALFAGVKFDSKWDFSCGMPITAGLEDTAHYNGKIYGFCSTACKEDFLKDPVAAIKSKN